MTGFIHRIFRLAKVGRSAQTASSRSSSGFTLIELLVAMIIASIVVLSLLSFLNSMLSNDRREQAKALTEQELQAALDYITRDMQQAVYIYDAEGINAIRSQLPQGTATDKFPVLVFWKREFFSKIVPVSSATDTNKNDAFVYSLVAYYLMKDTNATCANSGWSCAARIGRVRLVDSVPNEFTGSYVGQGTAKEYDSSPGFKNFDLTAAGSTVKDKMNAWTSRTGVDNNTIVPLIDYIDQTASSENSAVIPAGCASGQMVPNFTGSSSNSVPSDSLKTGSFYACVDALNFSAQVFLRGNASARMVNTNQIRDRAQYSLTNANFFPTVTARVAARGFLYAP